MALRKYGKPMTRATEHSSEYCQQMENDFEHYETHPTSLPEGERKHVRSCQEVLVPVRTPPLFTQWTDRNLIDTVRYCEFTKKNPVVTLESISINVQYAFFNWLLRERKDSIGAASSL